MNFSDRKSQILHSEIIDLCALLQVGAVDADTGDNAWVSYSLLPSSEFAEQFNMDDETGTFPCYYSLRTVTLQRKSQ
jgi:hypothetical protein